MSENLRIMCPSLSCRKVLAVPTSSRGKNVRCKSCGATIRVPDKVAAPVPDPKAAAAAAPEKAGGEQAPAKAA